MDTSRVLYLVERPVSKETNSCCANADLDQSHADVNVPQANLSEMRFLL